MEDRTGPQRRRGRQGEKHKECAKNISHPVKPLIGSPATSMILSASVVLFSPFFRCAAAALRAKHLPRWQKTNVSNGRLTYIPRHVVPKHHYPLKEAIA